MAKLPNKLSVENREYAASEVTELVIDATARELAACIERLQRRKEKATMEGEPTLFCSAIGEAILELRRRSRDLGIPHLVEDQVTTPLDLQTKDAGRKLGAESE